jgi:hypothetical protein
VEKEDVQLAALETGTGSVDLCRALDVVLPVLEHLVRPITLLFWRRKNKEAEKLIAGLKAYRKEVCGS